MVTPPPNPFRESRLNSGMDYHPEWDVLDLNAPISTWLTDAVHRLIGRETPDPAQMIAVMTGPPGYGKTHLFGRIEHQVGRDVFFVFVPAFEPETPPLDHIRRHAVTALFRKVGDAPSPLEVALAGLCQPAFATYFADLPPTLAARHDSIRQRLAGSDSTEAVLAVVRAVKTLPPFARLADSLVSVLPSDAGVTRALALGWAPAPWSDTARRWLQGQDLPEADVQALGLSEDPPTAMDVIQAIPPLFNYQQPLMICCDQIEGILQSERRAELIGGLTQSLMDLLQSLPVQIVLSCFKESWNNLIEGKGLNSFQMRVHKPLFNLGTLKGDQAVRLTASRLASLPDRSADKPPTWPFGAAMIHQVVADGAPTPRGLIQEFARLYDEWLEGDRTEEIPAPKTGDGPEIRISHESAFLAEWNNEIAAIKQDPARSVGQQTEDRLYRGVLEALKLAQSVQRMRPFGGVRIVDLQDRVIKATAPARRPGVRVTLAGGAGEASQTVVVAVTTLENAHSFNYYLRALGAAYQADAGTLLIHPRRDLTLGNNAQVFIDLERKKGRFRLLALEDHPLTFQALEALVMLLQRADERELVLNGATLTAEDCRDLVIKTGVIDNLDLFKLLGHAKKPSAPPVVTTTQPTPQPQPQPTVESIPQAKHTPPQPEVQPVRADQAAWAEDKLRKAIAKLHLFGLKVESAGYEIGPTFARLRVEPQGNTDFKKVSNRAVDLRIALGLDNVPIVGSQAGHISIDVQLPERATVTLAQALADAPGKLAGKAAFPVGQDVAGTTHWLDLSEPADCHLLVAGTTGSGKSEFLRAAIAALAARLGPDQLQFVLIDPKQVTFNLVKPTPYLRSPVAHNLDEAIPLIQGCMDEMDRRYAILKDRQLTNVGELPPEMLPRTILVIDEFASFLEDKESKKLVTALLKRIGAMARAAGIHLILATQRPDKDVIVPVLRENLPGRIALHVTNKAGSDLILGSPEAEHLLGKGDLFWKKGGELLRLQSPFVTQAELERCLRMG